MDKERASQRDIVAHSHKQWIKTLSRNLYTQKRASEKEQKKESEKIQKKLEVVEREIDDELHDELSDANLSEKEAKKSMKLEQRKLSKVKPVAAKRLEYLISMHRTVIMRQLSASSFFQSRCWKRHMPLLFRMKTLLKELQEQLGAHPLPSLQRCSWLLHQHASGD